ncbi:PP2C family protein-serine/threonine phosphatase [Niabella sp. CJ426]|uniref:PP2C family protein-serine/threonine phosphatase n=1 Tax=Niabella sp. CJ426 TaxID=3393740 RepID=UPI003D01F3A0
MEEAQLKQYKLDIISFTNQGLRQSNEDRYYHSQIDERSYLLLLADGMGGYIDGHLAAEMAIEEISNYIKKGKEIDVEQRIEFAFLNAHRIIKERLHNAGATVGGILFTDDSIFIFWAGDIKIMLISGSNSYSSKEHTLLNVLKDAQITIKAEEINRLSHTVVRSIGGDSKSYLPEIIKMQKDETFKGVLYSDGMLPYFSNDELLNVLNVKNYMDIREIFDPSIFDAAKDNVTGLFFFGKKVD